MNVNGYETFTTFWQDFAIADMFGIEAIKDTYERAFQEWKDNYKYLTELVMILNWKIWEHYKNGNKQISMVYDELWREVENYAYENLTEDELEYFYKTTN